MSGAEPERRGGWGVHAGGTGAGVSGDLWLGDELCVGRCGAVAGVELCFADCGEPWEYAELQSAAVGGADGAGAGGVTGARGRPGRRGRKVCRGAWGRTGHRGHRECRGSRGRRGRRGSRDDGGEGIERADGAARVQGLWGWCFRGRMSRRRTMRWRMGCRTRVRGMCRWWLGIMGIRLI